MLNRLLNALRPFTPVKLNQVIFFVTSRCNLKCYHCFNWKNLNHTQDLTLDEIKKISFRLPKFKVLLLSGGEPFLRGDLPEVIEVFRKNNLINFVGIPSNGSLGSEMISRLTKILKINPGLTVSIYLSIDGLEKFHDTSRGVKGSYSKIIKMAKAISELKKHYPNLLLNFNTVISSENIKEIPKLIDFAESNFDNKINGHFFELVRGSPRTPAVKNIIPKDLSNLYSLILDYQTRVYGSRNKNKLLGYLSSRLASATVKYLYSVQFSNFFNKKPWVMPCLAGRGIIVLDSDGKLRLCELREPVADLRKENYDADKYLHSPKCEKELRRIKKDHCFCTHACFINESMYKSPKVVFGELPSLLFKNRKISDILIS